MLRPDVHKYCLIEFICPGKKPLDRSRRLDCVPTFWLNYNDNSKKCFTKYLDKPYTPEKTSQFHELVLKLQNPLDHYEIHSVAVVGYAKTHKEALQKLERLRSERNVFTSNTEIDDDDAESVAADCIKKMRLMQQAKELKEAMLFKDNCSGTEEDVFNGEQTLSKRRPSIFTDSSDEENKSTSKKPKRIKKCATFLNSSDEENKDDTNKKRKRFSNSANISGHLNLSNDKLKRFRVKSKCDIQEFKEKPFSPKQDTSVANIEKQTSSNVKDQYNLFNDSFCSDNYTMSTPTRKTFLETSLVEAPKHSQKTPAKPFTSQQNSAIVESLAAELASIRTDMKLMNRMIKAIYEIIVTLSPTPQAATIETLAEKYSLIIPLTTKDEFDNFNSKLKNDTVFYGEVKAVLKNCLDRDGSISKTFNNMLQKFMSRQLAMSFVGSKVTKESRSAANLATDDKELLARVGKVLTNSRDWQGGRKLIVSSSPKPISANNVSQSSGSEDN